jgi:hypothetical protein
LQLILEIKQSCNLVISLFPGRIKYFLYESGLFITKLKELYSTKISEGKVAKMENRARGEFPLFLMTIAEKNK